MHPGRDHTQAAPAANPNPNPNPTIYTQAAPAANPNPNPNPNPNHLYPGGSSGGVSARLAQFNRSTSLEDSAGPKSAALRR